MKNRKMLSLGITLMMSVLFALVFYAFTTPLGPSIGSDNAIYMTMGTAVANGYTPYTEIFDHKGPMVYVLQTIPQLISGGYSTLAIFVQQVIFLFICLLLLEKIAGITGAPAFLVQLAYLALIATSVGGGNLTEEYSNVFTLVGLMIILRVFGNGIPEKSSHIFAQAAMLGAMAMLCFLVRANNALVLCAMTGVLAVCLMARKQWILLGRCTGGFTLGMVGAALPFAVWLMAQGALGEAIYGSILHNMMYAETGDTSRIYMLLHSEYGHTAILMAVLSCLGAMAILKSSASLAISMVAGAAAAGFAAFVSHKFYQHYLILGAPLAAMGVACVLGWIMKRAGKTRMAVCATGLAVCLGWLGMTGMQTNAWRLGEREGIEQFTRDAQELYAMVPEEERDRFFAYRAEPKWYVVTEALPCMRFYFLQEILADADPAVMDEIVQTFDEEPPLWIVIYYNRPFSPPYDERVQEIFDTRYEFVDARGQYQLLKLKETP